MMTSIFFLLLLFFAAVSTQQYSKFDLSKQWQMKILTGPSNAQNLKSKIYQTSIPTTVHLDLLTAGDIPDPFLQGNYPLVKWVSECNYLYTLNFTVSEKTYKYSFQKLVFEGIDTYSTVKLNQKVILETANSFRQYSAYVQGILKQGLNTLQVLLKPTNTAETQGQQSNSMPFAYAHTRKPGYQYSWDWAPYLNTLGIWKNVYLESFNELKIDYVWVRTRSISKEKAVVNFAIALQLPSKQLSHDYEFKVFQDGVQVAVFKAKQLHTYHDITVLRPQLWWPNGIGKPNIYDFTVQLLKVQGKVLVDQRKIPFGIRSVSLNLQATKFEVKVNGFPVYCKGANYVPPDMFYPRLQNGAFKPGNTIQNLINDAVESNFNMLRVWGGGQYQSDKFLELASRKGIMLFYDFMFSDSIYPSSEEFLRSVEEEVKQQIRRARNYPALALWSGNNQILQGIQDWGWSQANYKQDYKKLFETLIPKIIEYQSPYISYIPSSPVYGVGNFNLQRGGDVHYWGVWAGGSPFESYQTNVGSFNSQFGTQALPVWQTIIQTMSKKPSYQDPNLAMHQRHNSMFNTLRNYMMQYMKPSLNFQLQTYQSGLLQAYAIQLAIIAQRVSKPKSFGTLYWQFNDAWPAISWSSIDYLGRWKPLQFMAKRLYPDVAIFTLNHKIYAVNDKLYPVNALAIIEFLDLNGQLLRRIQKEVLLKANEVLSIYQIMDTDYKSSKKEQCVIYTQIIAGKSQTMSSTFFNVHFKELNLSPASIEVEYNIDFNVITIQTKTSVVKNLFISHKEKYLKTSNNYFDLFPGHPVKVIVESKEGLATLKGGLLFRSYREVYTADSQVQVKVK